jgi:hypothetical protein
MDMEFLPFLSVETLVCLYSYFNKKGKKRALNKKRSFSKKRALPIKKRVHLHSKKARRRRA